MVPTLYRRRQWRDRRAQTTLAELAKADMMIRLHCLLMAFFTALLVLVALFGQRIVDALFGGF